MKIWSRARHIPIYDAALRGGIGDVFFVVLGGERCTVSFRMFLLTQRTRRATNVKILISISRLARSLILEFVEMPKASRSIRTLYLT